MKADVLEKVNSVFDQVVEEYLANGQGIFESESSRKKRLYASVSRKLVGWNRSTKCIFRGCTSSSIKRSHAIQKAGPIEAASRDSHTLAPHFDRQFGEIVLKSCGLSNASVFPGFCEEHERLFSTFEMKRSLETTDAILLQIYRTICREVVRLRHDIAEMRKTLADYEAFRNRRILEICAAKLGSDWMLGNDISLSSIGLEHDHFIAPTVKAVEARRKTLELLENDHLSELELELAGIPNDLLRPIVLTIDTAVPVALSGFRSFWIQDGCKTKEVVAILGVYPDRHRDETKIFIHSRASDIQYVHLYASIFDDLRRQLILKSELDPDLDSKQIVQLEAERLKLSRTKSM